MTRAALEADLLAAHERDDRFALVDLYALAAQSAAGTEVARGFYLTQAFIYALETGHPRTAELRASLVEMGREAGD